ncbi:MAG TPA: PilZ domain-containing protein [Anaeromyxobacter sp.]|nr:PilZ domain-containing protein [Anaeromyxobacter sp.]
MVQEFFRSLSDAFGRGHRAAPAVELAILCLVALGVALQLASLARRGWRRRSRLRQLAIRHGIGGPDLDFAAGMARLEGVSPVALLTRLDVFERATARALSERPGPLAEPAERIRRLRRALGFDRLPPHTPLLTTRELSPGTAVEVGPAHGQVLEVGEAALWLRLGPTAPTPAPGEELILALAHAREARYELRCRVQAVRAGPDGPEIELSHDEAPRRVQLREYARAAARGAIALHPVPPWPVHADLRVDVVARLEDVSGGGAMVRSRAALPVGLLLHATFALPNVRFERLPAVVLASEPQRDGSCRARLEWGRLAEAERSRLVAAVMRLELLHEPG